MSYQSFLKSKFDSKKTVGFRPSFMPDFLFDFQRYLVDWSVRQGRCAIYADCGLGKGPMALVWASNIVRKTKRPVLILAPLSVSRQFVRECDKFGIKCRISDGEAYKGINVVNYERLHHFNPRDFAGLVCDESSAIKAMDGKLRFQVTKFANQIEYRLLGTATPAPNDYMELGTSAEALGIMSRHQMLGTFFTHKSNSTQQWELKGHAHKRFWEWVSTWAKAARKPSDLGPFDDSAFELPERITKLHVVRSSSGQGRFGIIGARTLHEQRRERRDTIDSRCDIVRDEAMNVDGPFLAWCHLNDEGDLLESIIPDAVQVKGSDKLSVKEDRLEAFSNGNIRVLITKPRIGGFGLNWQHCSNMSFFPSHSFEQYYQCYRRCWRFGQKNPVTVNMITSEREGRVLDNMRKKERKADALFSDLIKHMRGETVNVESNKQERMRLPRWL